MTISLLLFGMASDIIGTSSMHLELEEACTVATLKATLIQKFPGLEGLHQFAIAVNESYAADEQTLNQSDTVAIIPPVSGG